LIPLLLKSTPTRQLEELFRDKLLGTFRGDLLGTYSDFEIASHEEEKQADLFKNNLVGEHLVFLTKHAREAKQAKFEASLEQVRFDASQQARIADQQVRAAEAAVIDAAQRLRILGVSEDITKVLTPAQTAANPSMVEYEDVTAYTITAPFDGTIVARTAVPSQRVEFTDGLFSLADLTTVRVTANVPESRVGLLTSMGRPTLQVTAAAYPGRTFDARVIYVGEEVDPATRTVSLLAEMPNADGRLRPGMFVQIKLDSPEKTSALTVPAGAVVEIEGVYGVFRPGKDANMFTFAPIVAGAEANGRRTIVSGVAGGDSVVVTGAFTLKSELVLQNESEAE
jgi:cobalt-zinc-cadmium efflux system membrane fusion protein